MLILGLLCGKETELVAEKAYEMAINGETLEICHWESAIWHDPAERKQKRRGAL